MNPYAMKRWMKYMMELSGFISTFYIHTDSLMDTELKLIKEHLIVSH